MATVGEAVATVQRQLASAPIGVRQYERFNAREEALKVITRGGDWQSQRSLTCLVRDRQVTGKYWHRLLQVPVISEVTLLVPRYV